MFKMNNGFETGVDKILTILTNVSAQYDIFHQFVCCVVCRQKEGRNIHHATKEFFSLVFQ